MVDPCSISIMPSESSFKRQAELAQEALKTFTAVRSMKSTTVVTAAITELIDATVAFNHFVPFFVNHSLFQEIPSAVLKAFEDFIKTNPDFDMPAGIGKISGLDARARDAAAPPKKGNFLSFSFLFHYSSPLDSVAAVAPRVDKKTKTTVCPYLVHFVFTNFCLLDKASPAFKGLH